MGAVTSGYRERRPPSADELKNRADYFNDHHPIGTSVIYTSVKDDTSTSRTTKTRSEAWVMGGHSVMVMVEGVSGGVRVDHINKADHELSKEQWIEEVYKLLCVSQGAPVNETEQKNLRDWAVAIADADGKSSYYSEGMSPKDAHDEDTSCA